ncbi:MAG: 2-polyprenylphenol 6-hydroxylase [Rickettsiales bacterium]|nr:2-polyprenylphenol 6-hydroxylase [Rickettsiales bacterium]
MNILSFFVPIKIFLHIQFFGCNFLLRKIPYVGVLFWPFEIFSFFNIRHVKGKRLRCLLESLGPTYIKFGQVLSARPDLVGVNISNELAFLQDRLSPFSFRLVRKIFRSEINKDISEIFSDFAKIPVAAASIAQVHKAKTLDGKIVAVKILRPAIDRKFKSDISFFKFFANILNNFKSLKRLKLREVVEMFEKTVSYELDLRVEAANGHKLAENLQSNSNIIIADIDWSLTSSKIMVSNWIEGQKLNEIKGYSADELKKLGDDLILCYYEQAYRDGFFHADLHPGNIIITKDKKIAFVDFGIMGVLSFDDRMAVTEIVNGFINRDYDYVAKIHLKANYIPRDADIDQFAIACRSIGEPIFGKDASDISIAKLMSQLFMITESFGMQTQPQLLLLQKTLLLVEGVGLSLNPRLNMWKLGAPWMEEWVKNNLNYKSVSKHKYLSFQDKISEFDDFFSDVKEIIYNFKNKKRKKSASFVCGLIFGILATISFYVINL